MDANPECGITLTELTIVMVLAALITVGLVTFYLNSQGLWLDASSQALTQRDATLVLERITRQVHQSARAEVAHDPDSLHQALSVYDIAGRETRFYWDPADSLIHSSSPDHPKEGPIANSKVDRLQFDRDGGLVYLRRLSMRSGTGERIEMSSSMTLYNK